jgi:PAS domain S-box-containing protein
MIFAAEKRGEFSKEFANRELKGHGMADQQGFDWKQAKDYIGLAIAVFGWLGAMWVGFVSGLGWFLAAVRGVALSRALHARFPEPLAAWEQYQKQLRRVSFRFNVIANHSRVCYYECDAAGQCTFASQALCELFGVDSSAMLGSEWTKRLDESDSAKVWEIWLETVKSDGSFRADYTVVNARNGQRIAVESEAWRIPESEPVEFIGVVRRKAAT